MTHEPSNLALEEAAGWLVRLDDDVDDRTYDEFCRWRDSGPANAEAFRRMERAERWATSHAHDHRLVVLRYATLARVSPARTRMTLPRLLSSDFSIRAVSALGAICMAVLLSLAVLQSTGSSMQVLTDDGEAISPFASVQNASDEIGKNLFQTDTGQRATLTLPDGSKVRLNTNTTVKVDYSEERRRIYLTGGEAWFDVAKDSMRPFTVEANGRRITAHGTSFDVKLQGRGVEVMLVEGLVTVANIDNAANEPEVALRPNQLFVAKNAQIALLEVEDPRPWQSWRDGILVFEDRPLSEAVAEMNRYNVRKMVLDDVGTGELRISGVFRTGETDAFVDALVEGFDVAVTAKDDRSITLIRR